MISTIIDNEAWYQYLQSVDSSTFYNYPQWYEIWKKYADFHYECRYFEFESGLNCIVPIAKTNVVVRGQSYWVSSPKGTYGGIISQYSLVKTEVNEVLRFLDKRYKAYSLFFNPNKSYKPKPKLSIGQTQIIDLKRPWEDIVVGMKKAQIKKKLRKSSQLNLKIDKIKKVDVENYFHLYTKINSEWENATNDYRIDLFNLLYEEEKIDFWGVYEKDIFIGGGPFVKHKNIHISPWLTMITKELNEYRISEYFYYHVIKHYWEEGFSVFDFNPSGGHSGVEVFKQRMGSTFCGFYEYEKLPIITAISNKVRKWF